MFLLPDIILSDAGELFDGRGSAIDIVLDLFIGFILFDDIIPFISTEISGISANTIFFSVKQIGNCCNISFICRSDLDMMDKSCFSSTPI